jgi:hypothetical protein
MVEAWLVVFIPKVYGPSHALSKTHHGIARITWQSSQGIRLLFKLARALDKLGSFKPEQLLFRQGIFCRLQLFGEFGQDGPAFVAVGGKRCPIPTAPNSFWLVEPC